MWRIRELQALQLAAVLSALAFGAVLLPNGASPAAAGPLACSVGSDWDAIAESDVIIAGQITGYRLSEDAEAVPAFTPITLTWRVDDVLKGELRPSDRIVDAASLVERDGQREWHGSGGACGAFNADPTGVYAILGLYRAPDSTLQTSLPRIFYLGRERYTDVDLNALRARVVAELPAAGQPTAMGGGGGETLMWLVASASGAGVVTACAGLMLLRSRRIAC